MHGKSFIPAALELRPAPFPDVLATRTIENRRDRLATILVLMIVAMGSVVGFIAMSIILPIFKLGQSVK